MTSRILAAAAIIALTGSFMISSPVFASDGMRPAKHSKLGSAHRHHKTSVSRSTDGNGFYDEPYAGYRKDAAGNSYFYYRTGGDTPFGPGKGLRPPYPR